MKTSAKSLGKLALAGVFASLSTGCQSGAENGKEDNSHKVLSENELRDSLDPASRELFNAMDDDGKKLALQLANGGCKGQNSCQGLNSCKSENNACAGKAGCGGQSQCKFTDVNLAVKVAAKHMADERAKQMESSNSSSLNSSSRTRTTTTSWNRSWNDR